MESKIVAIKESFAKGRTTSLAITQECLGAIQDKNGAINAFCRTTDNIAFQQAADADAAYKSGASLSVLAGVPMAIKDNIVTKGIQTNAGTKTLEGYIPTYNASVLDKLAGAGAVMLGKTNMKEFAMGGFAKCISNPSGGCCAEDGAAVAVAAGMAVYALGTDTGGEIVRSAAECGIVGLRPTYGSVSRNGLIANVSSCDQIGVLASTVKDAAIVWDAIKGYDPKDMTSRKDTPTESTAEQIGDDISGKKIGIIKELWQQAGQEANDVLNKVAAYYAGKGVQMVEVSLPMLKYAMAAYSVIACAEASSNLGRYDGIRYGYSTDRYIDTNDMIVKTRTEGFGKEIQKRVMLGTYFLSSGHYNEYFKKAQIVRNKIVAEIEAVLAGINAFVAPTALAAYNPKASSLGLFEQEVCSMVASLAGLPAVSLPCGYDAKGALASVQLVGKRFGEKTILSLAYSYEQDRKEGI